LKIAASNDRLVADELRDQLGQCTIGREIAVIQETTSTNDSILQRASAQTPEGLVVFAEKQTAGRGQRENVWESAAHKGLWFSILLRPKIDISESALLTDWAAQTVAKTITEQFNAATVVKPPNDVYLEGKKVSGVLLEMRAQSNAPHIAVLGIGVNVNHRAEDFSEQLRERAASLAQILDRHIDRQSFAVALLRNLDRTYRENFGS
jgi:BirA family transcriptional regulator, biotin operon repressor / biotin---[acetyl-CoA-carboxylase] ligase